MLQEAPQKLLAAQPGDALVTALPAGPAEPDAILLHCRDPVGVHGGLLHSRNEGSEVRQTAHVGWGNAPQTPRGAGVIPRDIFKGLRATANLPRIGIPRPDPRLCGERSGRA